MTTLRFLALVLGCWFLVSVVAAAALSALFGAAKGGES